MTTEKRKTLRAIKASMAHWRRLWEGRDKDTSGESCALCQAFYPNPGCLIGCPLGLYGVGCQVGGDPYTAVGDLKFETDRGWNLLNVARSDEALHMWMVLAFIYEAEASNE